MNKPVVINYRQHLNGNIRNVLLMTMVWVKYIQFHLGNGLVLFEWLAIASTNNCNITSPMYLSLITNHVARDQRLFQPVNRNSRFLHSFQTTDHLSTISILKWCQHFSFVALSLLSRQGGLCHDDVIKWKHCPRYWPFARGIHRSPVNSPHKGQWRGALMFTLICARINGWVNNREAGDLRRYRTHYDVIVMRKRPENALSRGLLTCKLVIDIRLVLNNT